MLINLRNALMGGKRLPFDSVVEYLQSSGTQYINTGVKFTADNARVKFTASVTYANDTALCGSQNHSAENNYGFLCYLYNNAIRVYAGTSNTGATASLVDGNAHTVDLQANSGTLTKTIDGTISTHNYNGTIVSGEDFTIFTSWKFSGSSMTARCVSAKIYAFQIWNSGTLVRDFIPVRKGTVGYLYDRVSGKLFGNAGSGDFQYGQDVVPVEYIESSGTQWINTEFGFDSSTDRVELSLSVPNQTSSSNTWIWGRYFSNNTIGMSFRNDSVAAAVRFYFKATSPVTTLDFSSFSSVKHDVRFDSSGILVDGERQYSYSGSQFSSNSELYLFAVNNNGTASARLNAAVYSYSHYRNNVLVRNLKPVRVGTEGAMMDTLTRRIYRNAGTGAFAYGNDLKYPIPAA